ncbi:putative lipid II flippase FtsW [Comamonas serinivorans]|uniref:Probable peptidoglycan glycosyltransferase FtsW n=1 Tax=Comamonas serinivorans TaxID=1082851 RepID=A0A1Y0ESP2_9BURK|nr:putative lipid II flippase FtsW [Comamonas serinivorans]ARU06242.1 putative lipid II flippase FtsW [Comamonas serinivorans]
MNRRTSGKARQAAEQTGLGLWLHRASSFFGEPGSAAGAGSLPVRVGGMDFAQTSAKPTRMTSVDQALIWAVVGVLAWGLVMVFSASIAMQDNPRFGGHYSATYFLNRHLMWLVLAFIGGLVTFQIPMSLWERMAPWLFVGTLGMLIVVLIPGLGTVVNGARRWISLGPISFQPSEVAKLAMLMYAADYMVRRMAVKEDFWRAVVPMVVATGVVGGLLLAQPDMGAFLVIAVIAMGILFLGGVNVRMFIIIGTLLVSLFALIIALSPWRRERIFAYLDPWSAEHALGKGYQLSHSLIAIGRGEVFGVGLGGSIEKLHWLPEAHTDFLLAVIGEELGFVGVVLLVLTFFWLTRRIMYIGRQSVALDRVFSGLVAQGIGLWLGFQAFINIGVNLGALPTKGLTLPFMSYGGSAIMMNIVAMAVVLRIDAENRVLMRGGRP